MAHEGYFDLSPTDRSMAILDRTSPVAFHAMWDVVGPVELEAVVWAWQALTRVHPILTCTIDIDRDATWRPGAETPLNLVEGEMEIELSIGRELGTPVDLVGGPIVRLTAITRADGIRFVLAAHHAAFDGAASIFMIDDLRKLYLDRLAGREPTVEPDLCPRTVKSALRKSRLPLPVGEGFIAKSLDGWRRLPPSTHADPTPAPPTRAATGYMSIDLGPALRAIDERRRRNSWPMDAVLVGLLESAWNEVFGRGDDGADVWLVSSNLRAGLGGMRGAGNLSGVEAIAVRKPQAQSVDHLIQQAAGEIAATRSGFPGLGPELMARTWAWLPPAVLNQGVDLMIRAGLRHRYTRVISNLGRIPDSLSDWGQARLEGLRYLGPMARGPYCMFVAQSQAGSASLTVRTGPDWFTSDHARDFELAINRNCGPTPPRPAIEATLDARTQHPR